MSPRSTLEVLLVLSLALSSTGCCLFPDDATYYYPTDLVAVKRQAILWPADERGDEFRLVVQHDEEDLLLAPNRVVKVSPATFDVRSDLDSEVDSVTVLLRPESGPALRAASAALVEHAARALPALSTHVVSSDLDLLAIDSSRKLAVALEEERLEHVFSRPMGFGQAIGTAIGVGLSVGTFPDFVVLPVSTPSGQVAVINDFSSAESHQVSTMSGAEAVAFLTRELENDELRERKQQALFEPEGPFVAVLLPRGVPEEARSVCKEVAVALVQDRFAPLVLLESDTVFDWQECSSAPAVQKLVSRFVLKRVLSGTPRETVLLAPRNPPEPSEAAAAAR